MDKRQLLREYLEGRLHRSELLALANGYEALFGFVSVSVEDRQPGPSAQVEVTGYRNGRTEKIDTSYENFRELKAAPYMKVLFCVAR